LKTLQSYTFTPIIKNINESKQRRDFLKKSLIAAGGISIIPSNELRVGESPRKAWEEYYKL